MSKEVNELLDKLGKLEDAPLIWVNKKVYDTSKEIERLNNIINGIEKYCNDEINEGNKVLEKLSNLYNSSDTESFIKGQQAKCEHILDKLQELKGDGSNE